MPSNRNASGSSRRWSLDSSRRRFLEISGTALGVGSLAGCLSDLGLAKIGHAREKAVVLRWDHDGRTYGNEALVLWSEPDRQHATGRYDADFVGDGITPDDVTVTEEAHDRLARRFEVRYLLGVCGSDFGSSGESHGCLNTWTSREDFDRVQLNDRVEVRVSDHHFDVIDAYEPDAAIESTDVRTFDFAELHAEDGIRPERW